jgi:hypothetical protein
VSLNVIAVRIAPAAEGVGKVSERAPEPLDFLGGRSGDRRASRDMFPEFVQRHAEVFGGRSIQSQHDVVFLLGDLTVMPPTVRGAGVAVTARVCGVDPFCREV